MNLLLEMDPHLNFGLLSKKIKRSKLSCGVFFGLLSNMACSCATKVMTMRKMKAKMRKLF